MPAVGDLYVLKLNSEMYTHPMLNVFGYEATVTPGDANDLATQFIAHVIPVLQAIQNVVVIYDNVEVINTQDPADYHTSFTGGTTGSRTGQSLPTYACWTFKYSRSTRAVRNGYKRFSGVSESDQSGGDPDPGIVAALNACATELKANLVGASATYVPRILRATYPKPNPTHLPATYTSFAVNDVGYEHIGTQNSRKTY